MVVNLKKLQGKTVFITGATGVLGYSVVKYICERNEQFQEPVKILALVRDIDKAESIFGKIKNLKFIVGDVRYNILIDDPIDYIIHAASQTSSKAFVEEPVETIYTAVVGANNILRIAKEKKVKSFIYLSSMEVYGYPITDEKIDELHCTNLDTMVVRSSYPESKRMCENLCKAYCEEYGVPAKVIRLTQTFGTGVSYDDKRVFAEFARCVIEGRDIVLHTKGETKRNYLHTMDAVIAILKVLLEGENGQAYNAANEDTYCSIYEMAELVVNECANRKIEIRVEVDGENQYGFAPTLKMNLDTTKLQRLGWRPRFGLKEMFCSLIEDMEMKK